MYSKEKINLNKTGDKSRERKKHKQRLIKKGGFKREITMAATICGVEALSDKLGGEQGRKESLRFTWFYSNNSQGLRYGSDPFLRVKGISDSGAILNPTQVIAYFFLNSCLKGKLYFFFLHLFYIRFFPFFYLLLFQFYTTNF